MQSINQHSQPVTKTFGSLTITASQTVDGGYAINVFTGPIREDALCFTTADRDLYRRVYAVIGEGGNNRVAPEGIHAAVVAALTDDLRAAERRGNDNRIELIHNALDRFDPIDVNALMDLAANVGRAVEAGVSDHNRARTFADLKAAHARGLADARANRTGQPALFETEAAA